MSRSPVPSVPLVFVGLGPIGRSALSFALQQGRFQVIGACDTAPDLVGVALGDLVSGSPAGVRVVASIEELPDAPLGAVAVLCTASRIPAAQAPIDTLVRKHYSVVSSCEELTWPWLRHADWSDRLHERALQSKVAVLGSGINPGYLMDMLPVLLHAPCVSVHGVRIERVVAAETRRGPLQHKVGAGKTVAEFRKLAAAEQLGHVGLVESAAVVCAGLGWDVPEIEETLDPVVAPAPIETAFVAVSAGEVAGIDHRVTARTPQGTVELDLKMYLGAEQPVDRVLIDGDPPIRCTLEGGVAGDIGTVGMLLHHARLLPSLPPGLRTILDCPAAIR
jgi:4-hydroxy-tetrahydrodipicolinate reductase